MKSLRTCTLIVLLTLALTSLSWTIPGYLSPARAEVGAQAELVLPSAADGKLGAGQEGTTKLFPVIPGSTLLADIAEEISPTVVNIDWEKKVKQQVIDPFEGFGFNFGPGFNDRMKKMFSDQIIPIKGAGSGFIISKDGYILTNNHVVSEADKEKINVTLKDGRQFTGKIIGSDSTLDLAIVKIEAKNLPVARLGDSGKIRPGEWVIAIGNPYQFGHTVTAGIISATGRELEDIDKHNLIQIDAAINPGNSGGPLVNMQGEVIGISVAIEARAQGIGFAIPINAAKDVLNEMLTKGKVTRPYLGISMRDVDESIAEYMNLPLAQGVIIIDVLEDSPAAKAGLAKYDVILEIDKKKVKTSQDLQKEIRSLKVGQKVLLLVYRDGKKKLITATIGESD